MSANGKQHARPIGRAVRVAVLDSGVNAQHSHIQGVAGGIHFWWREDGSVAGDDDFRDLLGHGTAVAGVIRAKAPEAELYAVRVFDRELRTHAVVVAAGIRWAVQNRMQIINISLGTEKDEHRRVLETACDEAAAAGVILVAAADPGERAWFPANFDNVIAVCGDPICAWDEHMYRPDHPISFRAHPSPRPLSGRPQRLNLRGHSFAAAHITGAVAQLLQANPRVDHQEVVRSLIARARPAEDLTDRVHVS